MAAFKLNFQPSIVFGLLILSVWRISVDAFKRAPIIPGKSSINNVVEYHKVQKKLALPKEPTVSANDLLANRNNRRVEETGEQLNSCDICVGLHGSGILPDAPTPSYILPTDVPEGTNCSEWNDLISQNVEAGSYDCLVYAHYIGAQCCDRSNMTASYVCEANLKEELLGDDSGYDSTGVPVPAGEDGLDVNVTLTFWHITSVDTVEGTAEIFFSIDLAWYDERLTWDPADHGCLYMHVRSSLDPETTEIYAPDFNLLNRIDGVHNLPDEMAQLVADGTVHWSRNGGLKAICAFEGLEPIPFDNLGCYFAFGSDPSRRINYRFLNGDPGTPGLAFGHFPSKYQEFRLLPEKSETVYTEDGNLHYQFYFARAKHYYITKIVIPTILFTLLSFGTFMLDQRVGERLGFGVSLLLVMVAQSIVTADMLPISQESLWIDAFALWSYYWVIVAVFESVVVAYLYYQDSEEEEKRMNEEEEERKKEEEKEEERMIEEVEKRIENERRRVAPNDRNQVYNFDCVESDAGVEVAVDPTYYDRRDPAVSTNSTEENNATDDAFSDTSNDRNPEDSLVPERTLPRSQSMIPSSLFAVMIGKESGSMRWRLRVIRKLDRFSLIILPTTYLLFVIIMFATAKGWAKN